jgi:uncharacterized iron-regulated membrane protein
MRSWNFNVHLYVGVIAGAFFIVLGMTGALISFESPLDHLFHPRRSYVPPSLRDLPLSEIIHSVNTAFPSDDVIAITNLSPQVATASITIPPLAHCVV